MTGHSSTPATAARSTATGSIGAVGPAAGGGLPAPDPQSAAGAWQIGKGNLDRWSASALALVALLPVVPLTLRTLAAPGGEPGMPFHFLVPLGVWLERVVTLAWAPPRDAPELLLLLLLPSAALLIGVARLTFGLRLLGVRSFLIAIAIVEIGLLASLAVLALVVAVGGVLRPLLRRYRQPLYSRLTTLLAVTAMLLIVMLLAAPQLRSELVWSMAFFPVVITAMLAESIGRSLEVDAPLLAAWRIGWTVVVALILAALFQFDPWINVLRAYPELLLTQAALIPLIAEYLDWRLFETVPEQLAARWASRADARVARHDLTQPERIVVLRNRWPTNRVGRQGAPVPVRFRRRALQPLIDGLRDHGHRVRVVEGDFDMVRALREFLPPNPRSGDPGGLVLNLSTGLQGTACWYQGAALCEAAGVAYTGPDPFGYALQLDRLSLLARLAGAGLEVPAHWPCEGHFRDRQLVFPVRLLPRYRHAFAARTLHSGNDLAALSRLPAGAAAAVLEATAHGPRYRVFLLGNDTPEVLQPPPAGDTARRRAGRFEALPWNAALEQAAITAFAAARCRDYGRVDLVVGPAGPVVVDVRSFDMLGKRGLLARAAKASGYDYPRLIERIVAIAWTRYRHVGSVGSVGSVG